VRFVVESPTGQLEAVDSDTISHNSNQSGLWQTGVPDKNTVDQSYLDYEEPLPESVRPGKEPKIKDSELSEKDLARRNRRRQINRESARQSRERRINEKEQLENKIKELTHQNDIWKMKFEALLKKNKELCSKLEQKITTHIKTRDPLTQKQAESHEQATQTYQPGEYSNSNLSRNIINGSYKRRGVLLQAVEPQIANKKAKVQFIHPVSNSINSNHPVKKKILIVNHINKEMNISYISNDKANFQNLVTTSSESNIGLTNHCNEQTDNISQIQGSKISMSKDRIAAMITMMIEPMQQQIKLLTNRIVHLENEREIKIEP